MNLGEAWERRDWGGPKPTWRKVPAIMQRYPKGTHGPSTYSVRIVTNRQTKRRKLMVPT